MPIYIPIILVGNVDCCFPCTKIYKMYFVWWIAANMQWISHRWVFSSTCFHYKTVLLLKLSGFLRKHRFSSKVPICLNDVCHHSSGLSSSWSNVTNICHMLVVLSSSPQGRSMCNEMSCFARVFILKSTSCCVLILGILKSNKCALHWEWNWVCFLWWSLFFVGVYCMCLDELLRKIHALQTNIYYWVLLVEGSVTVGNSLLLRAWGVFLLYSRSRLLRKWVRDKNGMWICLR